MPGTCESALTVVCYVRDSGGDGTMLVAASQDDSRNRHDRGGARQHLLKLEGASLVESENRREGRGRLSASRKRGRCSSFSRPWVAAASDGDGRSRRSRRPDRY